MSTKKAAVSLLAVAAAVPVTLGAAAPVAQARAQEDPSAKIFTCEYLKAALDRNAYSPVVGDTSPNGWIALYLLALAKGCDFVKGPNNPYHVYDAYPGSEGLGAAFSLQGKAASNRCRGVIVEAKEDGRLWGADNKVDGCNASDREVPKNRFAFAATGMRWVEDRPDHPQRDVYRMIITDGPETGKCVGIPEKSADDQLRALPCEENTTFFVPNHDSGKSGQVLLAIRAKQVDHPERVKQLYEAKGTDKQNENVRRLGVMDIEGDRPDGKVILHPWKGVANQLFHYRPPGSPA
ncbi:hypothetical protein ACTVZO_43745 [Streptomyces sp. IBSNAI002]|uniref:hypothetical protein n=1 Tax=Streptomyces sp. IBSNAI002 TaxID=3457500 RepID=UPI003FD1198F